MLELMFLLVLAYLLGSIPSGLLLLKYCKKLDIRQYGSGNIGATNAVRVGGRGLGIATLICDCLKGGGAVLIAKAVPVEEQWLMLIGVAAIVGHIFPIWLRFKGGKGVATYVGVLGVISPWVMSVFLGVWLTTFALWRISSLSAILAVIVVSCAVIVKVEQPVESFCLIMSGLLILYKHLPNIQRLLRGQEQKMEKM